MSSLISNSIRLSLVLLSILRASHGAICRNRLDLVILLDSTSSESESAFAEMKLQVKDIVSGFTVGQNDTRLALVSAFKGGSQVVKNLDQVNSLREFNTAVDLVKFDSGLVDIVSGMQMARTSVLNRARQQKVYKILVLVKDRRSFHTQVADTAVRSRISAEAAEVRSTGTAIHAVGLGGLWLRQELEALFGTDYLLFKNKNKAMESIKSLNNQFCQINCPDKGKAILKTGVCFDQTRQVVTTKVDETLDANGLSVCRREITRGFDSCATTVKCDKLERLVSPCNSDGKVTVRSVWNIFDLKTMECTTNTAINVVDCKDALKCTGQIADIIFILDRSSSMAGRFEHVKEATRQLMVPLDVGPSGTRVALMTYDNSADMVAELGLMSDSSSLLAALNRIPSEITPFGKQTFTDRALDRAIEEFLINGRREAPRFVFLITDGVSTIPEQTFAKTSELKNLGVTIFAIGVGTADRKELATMTEPDTATNLVMLQFTKLETWSKEFSKRICIRTAAPHPKLCADSVFIQAISECIKNKQQLTRTEYAFDSHRNCLKTTRSVMIQTCRRKCIDPVNGNEQLQGESWDTSCHSFQCSDSSPKPFLPTKSRCLSSDGKCHDVGSQRFSCTDEKAVVHSNCQCQEINGKPTLVIETS